MIPENAEPIVVVPLTFAEANGYVIANHRHNGSLPTARIVCGIADASGQLRGVAIAGLPKARMLMGRYVLEVNRVCTDGVPNGCSMLYGAITRAAKALGYRRLITYTLEREPGSSLLASGWTATHSWDGGSWVEMRGSNGSKDAHDLGPKVRWEIELRAPSWLPVDVVFPDAPEPERTLWDSLG